MKNKFWAVCFLSIVILCSAGSIKAQSTNNSALIAQLQAEIAQLSAQLQALQAKQITASLIPAPTSTVVQNNTSNWCYKFTKNLKVGNTGTEVSQLQTALLKEGLFSGTTTNYFGPKTALAVTKFQEKYAKNILTPYGLTAGTGLVGPSTIAKLNNLYACAQQ